MALSHAAPLIIYDDVLEVVLQFASSNPHDWLWTFRLVSLQWRRVAERSEKFWRYVFEDRYPVHFYFDVGGGEIATKNRTLEERSQTSHDDSLTSLLSSYNSQISARDQFCRQRNAVLETSSDPRVQVFDEEDVEKATNADSTWWFRAWLCLAKQNTDRSMNKKDWFQKLFLPNPAGGFFHTAINGVKAWLKPPQIRRVFLCGDPGSGMTTTLFKLAPEANKQVAHHHISVGFGHWRLQEANVEFMRVDITGQTKKETLSSRWITGTICSMREFGKKPHLEPKKEHQQQEKRPAADCITVGK